MGCGQGVKYGASCGSVQGWVGVCGLSVVACGSFRVGRVGMLVDGGGGRGNVLRVVGMASNESGCDSAFGGSVVAEKGEKGAGVPPGKMRTISGETRARNLNKARNRSAYPPRRAGVSGSLAPTVPPARWGSQMTVGLSHDPRVLK